MIIIINALLPKHEPLDKYFPSAHDKHGVAVVLHVFQSVSHAINILFTVIYNLK